MLSLYLSLVVFQLGVCITACVIALIKFVITLNEGLELQLLAENS